jgi:PLP dependent protein
MRVFYRKVLSLQEPSFESRLTAVEERIQQAADRCGRSRSSITLVAVSKKFSSTHIRAAYEAGLRVFGENYVQEFAGKRPDLSDLADARFHLIGHLQSNKVRVACDLFDVIQTTDSVKLLQRLNDVAAEKQRKLEVMLEVRLSPEDSKTGALPDELPALIESAKGLTHLELTGLMTMPPWHADPEHSRPYFQRLAALATQFSLPKLSMGMSGDFEVAIEEGATLIRVGTALFGSRPKPNPNAPQDESPT